MESIGELEITQRFQFLEQLMNDSPTYQSHVLSCFNQIFGYEKGVFWEASVDGSELYNPTTFNISHEEMTEYCNHIQPIDPVYKLLGKLLTQSKFCYSDFLPSNNNVMSEFLYRYGNEDVLSVYIKRNNHVRGVLSFINTQAEKPFTSTDRERLHFLSNYISQQWMNQESLHQTDEILQSVLKKQPQNIIIFDENLELQCFNAANIIAKPEYFLKRLKNHLKNLEFLPTLQPIDIQIENYQLQLQYIQFTKIYFLRIIAVPPKNQGLTEREQQIIHCLKEGMSYAEISCNLIISVNTVKFHVKNIYQKLGISNRIELLKSFSNPSI